MNKQELNRKIRELDELRAQLIEQAIPADGIKALAEAQPMVKTGSKEHEALLRAGYGMDKAKAQTIIQDYKSEATRTRWPYEMLEKAEAFMEALATKTTVISTKPPWQSRSRVLSTA